MFLETQKGKKIAKLLEQKCWDRELKKKKKWDFPGGPVVKNLSAKAGDTGSIPGLGVSICHGATKPVHHNFWAYGPNLPQPAPWSSTTKGRPRSPARHHSQGAPARHH